MIVLEEYLNVNPVVIRKNDIEGLKKNLKAIL